MHPRPSAHASTRGGGGPGRAAAGVRARDGQLRAPSQHQAAEGRQTNDVLVANLPSGLLRQCTQYGAPYHSSDGKVDYSEFSWAGKSPIFHPEFRTLIQIASLTAGAAGVHAMCVYTHCTL